MTDKPTPQEKLYNKILKKHELQGNPDFGLRYLNDAREHMKEIAEIRDDLPGLLKKLDDEIKKVDGRLGELEVAGMFRGYEQFKDGDKMQLYSRQEQGDRIRVYVGNKKDLQKNALLYLENYRRHQQETNKANDTVYALMHAMRRMKEAQRILEAVKVGGE